MKIKKGDKVTCSICKQERIAGEDSLDLEAVALPGLCETCVITVTCGAMEALYDSEVALKVAMMAGRKWKVLPRSTGFLLHVNE